jgi:phospholipid N-methyltransferase
LRLEALLVYRAAVMTITRSTWRDFLAAARGDFRRVAALLPSSSASSRAIAARVPAGARRLVELGPGTGAVTVELLKRMPQDGELVAVEAQPSFSPILQRLSDTRLKLHIGDVREVLPQLQSPSGEGVDAVVSGIPFSFMAPDVRESLLVTVRSLLRRGGHFVVYQTSPALLPALRRHFGDVRWHFEPRNFPPYFVMVARR